MIKPFKKLDERVAIGSPDRPRSSVWRFFSTQNDVYVTSSIRGIDKFSFHASGVCRRAFTDTHGTPKGMNDRVIHRWRRNPTPLAGQQKATKVLEVAFPTDYLSSAFDPPKKKMRWIASALSNMSIILECFFTNDSEEVVRSALVPERSLQICAKLPNGETFCVTSFQSEFAGQDFSVPRSHGHNEDFVFLRDDPDAQGRPVRLSIFNDPKDGEAMSVWEYGGVRRHAPQTGSTLTRTRILDGTDWGRSSKQ